MSFFKQLLADAQPKADVIKRVTTRVTTDAVKSVPVTAALNIGYKGLVNTAAVGIAVVQPMAPAYNKFWSYMEELAKPVDSAVVKK